MQEVAVVGLDLAKNVFQVHGVANDGAVLVRRQVRRAPEVPQRSEGPAAGRLPPDAAGLDRRAAHPAFERKSISRAVAPERLHCSDYGRQTRNPRVVITCAL